MRFSKSADLFNESTEWLFSLYHFLCHDFGEDVYIHVIIKGGVVTIYASLEEFVNANDHERSEHVGFINNDYLLVCVRTACARLINTVFL